MGKYPELEFILNSRILLNGVVVSKLMTGEDGIVVHDEGEEAEFEIFKN